MTWLAKRLLPWAEKTIAGRQPDFLIGPNKDDPYMRRWWIIPRNRWFNIYLHEILHSDDDRALHDHPWFNASFLLLGRYLEHTIRRGGVAVVTERRQGDLCLRTPWAAHRLETVENERTISLFITGPIMRTWGFHCRRKWIPWKEFVDPDNNGQPGPGCGEFA